MESIEYDPNRTANIARVYTPNNNSQAHCYILAPIGLARGDWVQGIENRPFLDSLKIGNVFKLEDLPLGSIVHNIFFPNSKKSGLARSAGCFGILLSRSKH